MVFRMNPDEGDDEFSLLQPPTPPAPTPKEEIKIVDAATRRRGKACVVCGRPKAAYIEVDVDGVVEYTCQDCYELQAQGLSGEITAYCVKCGVALLKGDHFCGRCGTPAALQCPKCGARQDEEDAFCGKCGTALRSPP